MSIRNKPLRVPDVVLRKTNGPKITMLTAYDAAMAGLLAASGAVDILLVGDSLGMVHLGHPTTLPVTIGDMVRHTRAVRAGAPDALIVSDMPFLSYQISPEQALRSAGQLVQKGGATAVKMEGGAEIAAAVERIVAAGIPVMGHLGLRPQSVHALGGFRRQAGTEREQKRLIEDGLALQSAGAFAIVLECVPDEAAEALTEALEIPVIGIGSGPGCDGQVLVTHDLIGLTARKSPPFVKRYADSGRALTQAAQDFAAEVRSAVFPSRSGERTVAVAQCISELRAEVGKARRSGASVGFVPTMGALHAGHVKLIEEARRENGFVVVSIFVNPLQFDRKEDLDKYPRTTEADLAVCRAAGADLVFVPDNAELYPAAQQTVVETAALAESLCGAHRPGHFKGVETVVLKLFNLVQPDRAYFGEKDAQQLAIIRNMVRDLNVPVQIVPVATVREADGLALSSRNKLLTAEQRAQAPVLYRALQAAAAKLDDGERSAGVLRQTALELLGDVKVEYLELSNPDSLKPVQVVGDRVLIAAAIWMGTTRLIDNITWRQKEGTRIVS